MWRKEKKKEKGASARASTPACMSLSICALDGKKKKRRENFFFACACVYVCMRAGGMGICGGGRTARKWGFRLQRPLTPGKGLYQRTRKEKKKKKKRKSGR